MEQRLDSIEPSEPEAEERRFLLLQWWDRLVQAWQERRARRAKPIVVDDAEIARWIALLGRPEDPGHAQALDELIVIGRPAVPALLEALDSDTWIQAFRATEALGLIGDRRAIWPLKRLLDHPNSNVRWGAAEALGRIQSRWPRGTLRRVAQEDENRTTWGETVAEAAERAVANIDRTWVSHLINLFQVVLYLALCAAVIFAAFWFIRDRLENLPLPTPTPEPTVQLTAVPTSSPTLTPVPLFAPISATISSDTANVRDQPGGTLIGVLHYGDEVLVYGGRMDQSGAWWYQIRLVKKNNPATDAAVLEGGAYGWVHYSLLAGVTAPAIAPTVQAIETMRAREATPTPIGSSLELTTPTSSITATLTPTPSSP